MQFGGWSQFGNGSQFGSDESRARDYYRILKDLRPPGVYSDDDDSVSCLLARVDAAGLGNLGQAIIHQLSRDIFPQTAEALLGEWEQTLKVVPPSNATLAERQAACLAKWRGALSSSPKHLRQMLAPVLNPSTMFWDRCDDSDVSFRYLQIAGNGTITEDDDHQDLYVPFANNGKWDGTVCNAPIVLIPFNDRNDDISIAVNSAALGGNVGSMGGAVLYESETSALITRIHVTADGNVAEAIRIEDGTLCCMSAVLVADTSQWVSVQRVGEEIDFLVGETEAGLVSFYSLERSIVKPRYGGAFAAGDVGTDARLHIDDIKLWQGKSENNVELIEMPLAEVPVGNAEAKFFAFVHREPTDSGSYNLIQAQRILDTAKQGHTLILVGESDCFRCDDDYSLTDRDVLGS